GMVEGVEHLHRKLQPQSFGEAEPLCKCQILIHIIGCPQIGKVAGCIAEREVRWRRKGCGIEKAVLRPHRDDGDAVSAAAVPALQRLPSQIGMLTTSKDRGGVSASADRHGETALC